MEENKQRSDKGFNRNRYKSTLHPRYRSFLMKCNRYEIESPYTEEQYMLIISNPCYYCGASVRINVTRIEMVEDFSIENIRPCCAYCNMLKATHSEKEFLSIIRSIVRFQAKNTYNILA